MGVDVVGLGSIGALIAKSACVFACASYKNSMTLCMYFSIIHNTLTSNAWN